MYEETFSGGADMYGMRRRLVEEQTYMYETFSGGADIYGMSRRIVDEQTYMV